MIYAYGTTSVTLTWIITSFNHKLRFAPRQAILYYIYILNVASKHIHCQQQLLLCWEGQEQ